MDKDDEEQERADTPGPGGDVPPPAWPATPGAMAVKVRSPGEGWSSSRITALSVDGFCLQTFMKLAPGGELWIMLPGFEGRRARVLATRGHEATCAFERPLHPAIHAHLLRAAGAG